MKLIKLNESQYKRLFEDKEIPDPTDDEETIQSLGDEDQSNLPTNSSSEVRTSPVGADPLGGIKQGPDGEFGRTGLDKNMSRNGAFNSGGLRGGTGGF